MSSARSVAPRTPGAFTIVFATLLAGLAGGALWCLLSLGLQHGESALIVPLGAVVGLYLRWLGIRALRGVVCASVSMLIAFLYAQYLFAAVRIAQMLGFSLRSTLFQMDVALGWQVARANVGVWDLVFLLAGFALGAFVVRKAPRTRGGAETVD